MTLQEFLQHSKESRAVLGRKEASKGREEGNFKGKGGRKLLGEGRKEAS